MLPHGGLQYLAGCLLMLTQVDGGVQIKKGPINARIRAGNLVRFLCTAATDSLIDGIPTLEWLKDDERINYAKATRFKQNPVDNTLTIRNASSYDTGVYTCQARVGKLLARASAQLIVEAVPDPPVNVHLISCEARVAQIQWKLISENYSPVKQFIIEFNTSFEPNVWHVAKTKLPRTRHYQRIALSPWGNFSFRVIAQNAVGNSKPSVPSQSQCITPPDVPHHNPRDVCTQNVDPHKLKIHWKRMPKNEHNGPGFYYLVRWRRHNTGKREHFKERIIDKDLDSITIENQPLYKPYEIYVLAVNQVGKAVAPPQKVIGYSGESTPLEIPQNFRINPKKKVTDTTADFIWDSVDTKDERIQGFFRGYKIQFWKTEVGQNTMREHNIIYAEPKLCGRDGRHKRDITSSWRGVSSGHVYNLWPFTNITAHILVVNEKYFGPPSKPIFFSTQEGVPGPVENFHVHRRGATHIDLRWEKPKAVHGILVGYSVAYRVLKDGVITSMEEVDIKKPEQHRYKLRGLKPRHKYRILIWARTSMGKGQVYEIDEVTRHDGPPLAPKFSTNNISQTAVNVTWFPSKRGNPGSVFSVHYRKLGEMHWVSSKEVTDRSWVVVNSLTPGIVYEMRVVAKNDDDDNSLETSSPVRRIRLGSQRNLTEPMFKVVYLDKTSFGVSLIRWGKAVDTFFVQYKIPGSDKWITTDDVRKENWAIIRHLDPGETYLVRVIAKSSMGEAVSLIQEVVAGQDPGTNYAKAAVATDSGNGGQSHRQNTPYWFIIVYSLILILGSAYS